MKVLVQNLSDFLKLLIQSFNLSAVFPAFIFISLVDLYIMPILPPNSFFRFAESEQISLEIGLTIILVAVIAYLLDAANFQVIRLFEGFWFRGWPPFSYLEEYYRNYVDETRIYISDAEKMIDKLTREAKRNIRLYDRLHHQRLSKTRHNLFQIFLKKIHLFWLTIYSRLSGNGIRMLYQNQQPEITNSLLMSAEKLVLLANQIETYKVELVQEIGDKLPLDPDYSTFVHFFRQKPDRWGDVPKRPHVEAIRRIFALNGLILVL